MAKKGRTPQAKGNRAEAVVEMSSTKQAPPPHLPSQPPQPTHRLLRGYAFDPSLATKLETALVSEITYKVPWEQLAPGPIGEYVEVGDYDPPSACFYAPVDLDHSSIVAQNGLAPSEGNPQFHQQMVYAASMTTIDHFERALGREALWADRYEKDGSVQSEDQFVKRLHIYPHALRMANAYYSRTKGALLFGYFPATEDRSSGQFPGGMVFPCLSHDVVTHETTHALLDGFHEHFMEATNWDVLASHEAFADIVALMQHFTIPKLLEGEIRRTRGDVEAESMLGSLAVQFGRARGGRGALREAIGRMEDGVWKRFQPNPTDLQKRLTPHARGAILVAAVFDAFIAIYKARIADLLRINTGGTGVLPTGAIHADRVRRLTDEAATSAGHVLHMCIRALDYLPPVDVTFFEYLRALITADFDLVRDDRNNYRVAFVEVFRRRGIYPVNLALATPDTVRTLSVDTLRWQGLDYSGLPAEVRIAVGRLSGAIVRRLKRYADQCLYLEDRERLFKRTREERRRLHDVLEAALNEVPDFAAELGLDPTKGFEVHELRPAMRISPDGRHVPQVVVALTQSKKIDDSKPIDAPGNKLLAVDLSVPEVKYRIIKNIKSADREGRTPHSSGKQWPTRYAGSPSRPTVASRLSRYTFSQTTAHRERTCP